MKPKILVVDDDDSMIQFLKHLLTGEGYEVITAINESQFTQIALKCKPDLIVLDIVLGHHDGSEAYQKLVAQGLDRSIPVIYLSGLAQDRPPSPPQPQRRFALIGKPFDAQELLDGIKAMLPN